MTELNSALQQLKTTVSTINEKVELGKEQAKSYKQSIIAKLTQVVEQLRQVQDNPNLKNIPNLQSQLAASNNALQQKTSELAETRKQLENSNAQVVALNKQNAELTQQLNKKDEELRQKEQQLRDLQAANEQASAKLNEKTSELAETRKQLENSNAQVDTLNKQNADLTQQVNKKDEDLRQKEQQLRDLQAANEQASAKLNEQIKALQAEIDQLRQQKNAVEQQLAASNQQLSNLVRQIGEINEELNRNIELINGIAGSLGSVDSPELSSQFEAIAQNIAAIVKMINGEQGSAPPPPGPSIPPIQQKYNALTEEEKGKLSPRVKQDIEGILKNKTPGYEDRIRDILRSQGVNFTGGGRRGRGRGKGRKTRKVKKYVLKGGYVYTSSRELDKSSSIISRGRTSAKRESTKRESTKTRSTSSETPDSSPDSVFKRKTKKNTFRKRRTTRKHRHTSRKRL